MRRFLIASCLVGAVLFASERSVPAGQARESRPAGTHVVRPGESLWDIAKVLDARGDPRAAVHRLMVANGLDSPGIRPGEALVLPAR